MVHDGGEAKRDYPAIIRYDFQTGGHDLYYITVNRQARLLRWNDVFKKERIADVQRLLGKTYAGFFNQFEAYDIDDSFHGELSEDEEIGRSTYTEQIGDDYFPVPALLENGVVFSYPITGVNAVSLPNNLFFVLPYTDLKGMRN